MVPGYLVNKKDHCICAECGHRWDIPYENLIMLAKMKEFKSPSLKVKKYYNTGTFTGLEEAVSRKGGEDAFAKGITDAIQGAIKRAANR